MTCQNQLGQIVCEPHFENLALIAQIPRTPPIPPLALRPPSQERETVMTTNAAAMHARALEEVAKSPFGLHSSSFGKSNAPSLALPKRATPSSSLAWMHAPPPRQWPSAFEAVVQSVINPTRPATPPRTRRAGCQGAGGARGIHSIQGFSLQSVPS